MFLSRLLEEAWAFRGWKHHERRSWPRHQNDTVHPMLSVTIVSVCVPRKIMDYTVTLLLIDSVIHNLSDHVTLVVILCTLQQSFPYQLLLFQCWGPCCILHWTIHTETWSHKRYTEGKTPKHSKFWYPCRDWLGWRCSSEDPYTPGLWQVC